MGEAQAIASVITAVAHLLWPIIILITVILLRDELKALIRRLRRGRFFGQEIELDESLQTLHKSVQTAADELSPKQSGVEQPLSSGHDSRQDVITEILNLAASQPKVALLRLSEELERELRNLLGSLGLLGAEASGSVLTMIHLLEKRQALPPHAISAIFSFWQVRNQIVHGPILPSRDEILSAIDSGLTLLRSLWAVPHEVCVVHDPGVQLFSDPNCTEPLSGAKGLILQITSPGGAYQRMSIFPTTRTRYIVGKRVTWEWNMQNKWGPTWYKDPSIDVCKKAWDSSAEFVGRHLD